VTYLVKAAFQRGVAARDRLQLTTGSLERFQQLVDLNSLLQSLLIMVNLPLSMVGGIGVLWLRGLNLNLSASIGFIALFGVAVLNGLVMVTYINHLRSEGRSLEDSVLTGAVVKLRAVIMTAVVPSIGFIPMALSTQPGAEVQRPLATVVIGGLVAVTPLTLFVLPTLYQWMEEIQARRGVQNALGTKAAIEPGSSS